MSRTPLDPTEIIKSPRLEIANRVEEMDTPMLRQELARALTVTAETLAYLAAIWRELERRGEDLSDLRAGVGQYLPLIAAGQLDAEAVVRFAGRTGLLRAVQTLPVGDQRRLALGGKVPVVVASEDGRLTIAKVPAHALTGEQIRLAFDIGRLRPVDEQRNIIASARTAARRHAVEIRRYRVRVDREAGTVQVGKMAVSIEEVMEALRDAGVLADDDGG